MKRFSLDEVSKTENELIQNAPQEYGKYYEHAQYAVDFLQSFIKSISYDGAFFLMFFASVEKHIILGALSGIRLHHVQANFNFRYATEAGAWAAYALAHPHPDHFAGKGEDTTLDVDEKYKKKMYKWLDENYPEGSASLKRFKGSTNKLSTHANIVDAYRNFADFGKEKISTSFFDQPEEHIVKTDLWTTANITMGLLDLFYGVNKGYPQLVFSDDFLTRMQKLKETDASLKEEMMNHPRLKIHNKKNENQARVQTNNTQ